MMKMGIWS